MTKTIFFQDLNVSKLRNNLYGNESLLKDSLIDEINRHHTDDFKKIQDLELTPPKSICGHRFVIEHVIKFKFSDLANFIKKEFDKISEKKIGTPQASKRDQLGLELDS